MPNWTENTIKFSNKKDFDTVVRNHVVGKSFDFNTLVPMPDRIKDTESSGTTHRLIEFAKPLFASHTDKEILEMFKEKCQSDEPYPRTLTDTEMRLYSNTLANIHEYGTPDWYEWSCKHWGTKWNACDTHVSEDKLTIHFSTAWCMPVPVFEEIARRYPEMRFEVLSVDEDYSPTSGVYECEAADGNFNIVNECGMDYDGDENNDTEE